GLFVAVVSVVRQRRTDFLWIRLGIAAARDWILCDLSWRSDDGAEHPAAGHLAMGVVSRHVRRRADQAARRFVLAGPERSQLLLRDTTDSERAQLVLPLAACERASCRRRLQSCGGTWSAVPVLCSTADRGHCWIHHHPFSAFADRERKSLVAELDDDR